MNFNIKKTYFLLPFVIIACASIKLLNFNEYSNKEHISIIHQFLAYDDSSNAIVVRSYINEKKSKDHTLVSFSEDKLASGGWTLILSGEQTQYGDEGTILANGRTSINYSQWLEPNRDTSFILLSKATPTTFNGRKRALFLIGVNDSTMQQIISFTPRVNFISKKVPFATTENEYRYYDVQPEAKWINDTTFIIVTDEGIFQYSINNLSDCKTISKDVYFSNYYIYKNSLLLLSNEGIIKIDIDNGKRELMLEESKIFELRLSGNKLFYINRWSLKCYDLDSHSVSTIFKGNNPIKDYWIGSNGNIVLRSGDLTNTRENNEFICVNVNNQETKEIDISMASMINYYLTNDNKYFIIHKKTVQIKTYEIFLVYDIENKHKLEFDYEGLNLN